jgi:hypothetical protein
VSLTEVWIQYDAELRGAQEEGREEAPYLRRQSKQSIIMEVNPLPRQKIEVHAYGRDENARREGSWSCQLRFKNAALKQAGECGIGKPYLAIGGAAQ